MQENIFSLDRRAIDRRSFCTALAADKPRADGGGDIF